jgi:hypothetical protein
VNTVEGLVLETQYFDSTMAGAGLAMLLAVAIGSLLFGYIAEEEARGRRIDWLEEPQTMPGEYTSVREAEEFTLTRAA